jgi:hypothetical protein
MKGYDRLSAAMMVLLIGLLADPHLLRAREEAADQLATARPAVLHRAGPPADQQPVLEVPLVRPRGSAGAGTAGASGVPPVPLTLAD